jgi:hypothetical protein
MKQINCKWFCLIAVFALTSLTLAGCGKNVVGPSMPNSVPAAGIDNQDSAGIMPMGNTSEEACGKKGGWTQVHYRDYLLKLTPHFVSFICKHIAGKWFGDEAVTKTVENITESRLFNIIMFRCGVGPLIMMKTLKILSNTWSPWPNINPRNCTPKVTLFPYAWDLHQGFYGEIRPGWQKNGGYYTKITDPQLDYVGMDTGSQDVDIYQNAVPIRHFQWQYGFAPADGLSSQRLGFSIDNFYWDKQLVIGSDYTLLDDNGPRIIVREVWASTETKAARCKIASENTDWLNMDLKFVADGSGGGTMDIIGWNGKINHYEFTVLANGHGFYTENGGGQRRF